jgi:hypothetical protein
MEEALRLLQVLVAHDCRADAELATTIVEEWFIEADFDGEECLVDLATAAREGWLVSRNPGTIAITMAGLAVATRSVH